MAGAASVIEQVIRHEWGRVLALLVGFLSDFDLAGEVTAQAFAVAAERWPRAGQPDNPGAWLVITTRNRALDRLRRERTLAASLYGELAQLTRSPVVELNRAVAVAQAGSSEAALEMTEGLPLRDYQYLYSTRAELLRRLGRTEEARAAYQRALELANAEPERRFLRRRLTEP